MTQLISVHQHCKACQQDCGEKKQVENCWEGVCPRKRRLSEWRLETNSTLWLLPQGFPQCLYFWSLSKAKPQGTTTFADIVDDHSDSSSEDDEEDESDEEGGIEDVEEEGEVN